MNLISILIKFFIIYGGFITIIYFVFKIISNRQKIDTLVSRDWTLLEILVPKNNEKGPLAAEQMFAALHGVFNQNIQIQERFSFEIIAKNNSILFYTWVPTELKDFLEGQIYAQYPTVEINETSNYTDEIGEGLAIAGTHLVLNKNEVFPIKTFDSFEVDPLSGITGVLSKISLPQQVWIQIIVRPVSDEWQLKGINYVNAIRQGQNPMGESFGSTFAKSVKGMTKDFVSTAFKSQSAESAPSSPEEVKLSAPEEAGLSGIEEKINKLGYETTIRLIAYAGDDQTARSKLMAAVSAFKQFNIISLNGFGSSEVITDNSIYDLYIDRSMPQNYKYIFNISELASIWHLPSISVETPAIAWAGSKKGEPPNNLPVVGTVSPEDLTLFGVTNFRHLASKFGIKTRDRRLHFYAIGKTGTGKSTLLENMIIEDISVGRGVAVVDPHGDLVDHILDYIPASRVQDVVYFAPADRDYPVGFNILESVDPDLKNIVASGVVGIFKKIFGESWGPRLEYILRNTVLSLLDFPNSTMLGIIRMLTDKVYRKEVVSHIQDPVIYDFWVNEFDKYDQKFRSEAVAPIQNKVGQFLSTSTIRNIVGQPTSSIDLTNIMDTKKILLIDLSIGKIGEDIAALLGAMMITKIQLSAMQRANIPEAERVDFYLYVDEFQNFATDSFATILSEARKYRLNLIMTNQYIAQMPETVQSAVFGNVGTIVSFRVGAGDASVLVKEFEPVFDANDLVNLDNYNIYIKMAVDGVTTSAFSALTLPPSATKNNLREEIIAASREQYSRPKDEVESVIKEDSNLGAINRGDTSLPDSSQDQLLDKIDGYTRRRGKESAWYVKLEDDISPNVIDSKSSQTILESVNSQVENKLNVSDLGNSNNLATTEKVKSNLPIIKKNHKKILQNNVSQLTPADSTLNSIPLILDDQEDPLGLDEDPNNPSNQPQVYDQ